MLAKDMHHTSYLVRDRIHVYSISQATETSRHGLVGLYMTCVVHDRTFGSLPCNLHRLILANEDTGLADVYPTAFSVDDTALYGPTRTRVHLQLSTQLLLETVLASSSSL